MIDTYFRYGKFSRSQLRNQKLSVAWSIEGRVYTPSSLSHKYPAWKHLALSSNFQQIKQLSIINGSNYVVIKLGPELHWYVSSSYCIFNAVTQWSFGHAVEWTRGTCRICLVPLEVCIPCSRRAIPPSCKFDSLAW